LPDDHGTRKPPATGLVSALAFASMWKDVTFLGVVFDGGEEACVCHPSFVGKHVGGLCVVGVGKWQKATAAAMDKNNEDDYHNKFFYPLMLLFFLFFGSGPLLLATWYSF